MPPEPFPDSLISRIPPQSLESEQGTLGSMMLAPEAIETARGIVQPEDFYREAHRRLFDVIVQMKERGEPVDLVTLRTELERRKSLEAVGGIPYLASLLHIVPSAANVAYYARIVRDKATLRQIISAATLIEMLGYDARDPEAEEPLTADDVMERAQQLLVDIVNKRHKSDTMIPLPDALLALQEQAIATKKAGASSLMGVPTGFGTLDYITLGLHPEQFIAITGPTGKGKSALAMDIVASAAKSGKGAIAVFSAEMSAAQLARRMVAQEGMLDSHRLRASYLLDDHEWARFYGALGRMDSWPVHICDRSGITLSDVRSDCYQVFTRTGGLALVVVDYIQLLAPMRKADNREQEVAQNSRGLKALARDFQCPVLVLSQLNDQGQTRESRSIEHDADLHLTLRWEEPKKKQEGEEKADELIDVTLIVKKHREGATVDIAMKFNGPLTQFSEVEKE